MCQRLPLTSFLILPFQRVTRLKMLVEVAHFTKRGEREGGPPPLVSLFRLTFQSLFVVIYFSSFLLACIDYSYYVSL